MGEEPSRRHAVPLTGEQLKARKHRRTALPRRKGRARPVPALGVGAILWRGVAVGVLTLPLAVLAATPIEESQPARVAVAQSPAADRADAETSDGGLGALYYQLQGLQDDVRRLQGIVEEQNYRIERLLQEQRERYLELDARLLALTGGAPASPNEGQPPPLAGGIGGVPSSEREAYNAAFAVVRDAAGLAPTERKAAYEQALAMFEALIDDYPSGDFTANAYYWTGEARLFMEEFELARQAFVQVVNLFTDSAKVPDALYKLGVVHHQLQDVPGALHYLDRTIAEFPDHTAARLARPYAAELR